MTAGSAVFDLLVSDDLLPARWGICHLASPGYAKSGLVLRGQAPPA